jgi:hypothetical protein
VAVAVIVNESRLQMHFRQSGRILASAVHRSAQLQVEADFVNSGVIGGLYGPGCERISRNRGRSASVAPLLCLGQVYGCGSGTMRNGPENGRIVASAGIRSGQSGFRSISD